MTSFCGVCGTTIDHSEKFCTQCGAELDPLDTSSTAHHATPTSSTSPSHFSNNQSAVNKQQKRLYRCCCDTIAGGVCAGLAEYSSEDVNLIRLVVIIATLITGGTIAIAYIIAWAILPVEPVELHNSREQNLPLTGNKSSI